MSKYKEIYNSSIKNKEDFWKKFLKIFFGMKNQQKF